MASTCKRTFATLLVYGLVYGTITLSFLNFFSLKSSEAKTTQVKGTAAKKRAATATQPRAKTVHANAKAKNKNTKRAKAPLVASKRAPKPGKHAARAIASQQSPSAIQEEPPVADPALERRLSRDNVYRAHAGETLRSAAKLLYAHSTWWPKLKPEPGADGKKYGPDDLLPEKLTIHYRSPELGTDYLVRESDCLIRIAQWKYGSSDLWEEIFRKNAGKISNPNLIHPGDHLYFGADGTVQMASRGAMTTATPTSQPPKQTIMQGVGAATTAATAPNTATATQQQPPPPETPPAREPATQRSSAREDESLLPYGAGILAGILFFLITPLLWWRMRNQEGLAAVGHPAQADGPAIDATSDAKFTEPLGPDDDGGDDDYGYVEPKKSALDLFRATLHKPWLDLSLVRRDGKDIDRRPSYFSLQRKRRKRYIK